MAMKCLNCGAENPEDAKFCQVCGRSVVYGHQHQQFEPQKTATTAAPQPYHRDERKKGSDLPLATTLLLVGVAVVAFSVAASDYSRNPDNIERDAFGSAAGNGFLMAVVGAGMMVYLLSRRRASLRPENKAGERPPEKSFFHEMEPPTLHGVVYEVRAHPAERETNVSGGVKAILYLLSIFIPGFGSIAGAALYVNAKPNYGYVGRKCMIISVLSLVAVTVLIGFVYAVVYFHS